MEWQQVALWVKRVFMPNFSDIQSKDYFITRRTGCIITIFNNPTRELFGNPRGLQGVSLILREAFPSRAFMFLVFFIYAVSCRVASTAW